MGRLQIVTAPGESLGNQFVANRLVSLWREQGHEVLVGSQLADDVELALLHVNRTRVEPQQIPNTGEVILLNSRVQDISKRSFSEQLLTADSEYSGPVIIKTNENFFGLPELAHQRYPLLAKLRRRLVGERSWKLARQLPWRSYPVLESLAAVPDWVWQDAKLVVEKFLAERDDNLYVLRSWMFLGNRGYVVKLWGRYPVVKSRGLVRYEYRDAPPAVLQAKREELGFDYGKFDYVMQGDDVILLDINNTPTTSAPAGRTNPYLIELTNGLSAYLPDWS